MNATDAKALRLFRSAHRDARVAALECDAPVLLDLFGRGVRLDADVVCAAAALADRRLSEVEGVDRVAATAARTVALSCRHWVSCAEAFGRDAFAYM